MKVLLLTSRFPNDPPEEAFIEDEVTELDRLGVELTIVPIRAHKLAREVPDGIEVHRRGFAALDVICRGLRSMLQRPTESIRILLTLFQSPRHLHKNAVVLPLAFVIADQARSLGFDHIHAHWLSPPSTVAWVVHRLTNIPFSVTTHRWDIYDNNLGCTKARDAEFIRFISRAGLADFARITGTSDNLEVIRLGIRLSPEPKVDALTVARSDRIRLVSVGHLIEIKGHRHLIDALAILAARGVDATLEIYGEGHLRDELESQISVLGLSERVRLCGAVPRTELLSAYSAGSYDCLVMPSVRLGAGEHEGVPAAIIEALSRSLCVIATETGSIPELVSNGETGLLVPDKDPEALANAVEKLRTDPVLRKRLAAGGHDRVVEEFDVTNTVRRLITLWSRC